MSNQDSINVTRPRYEIYRVVGVLTIFNEVGIFDI